MLADLIILIKKINDRIFMFFFKRKFRDSGENVTFFPTNSYFSYQNIILGNHIFIGPRAYISSSESTIVFKNKIMLGPDVTIIGGNHNTSKIGEYMFDVKEKRKEDDLPVIIEDDVWIGARVTILKGVTIGRGAVIAAGSLVNKNVAPYSIVGGVPARQIKMRFNKDQVEQHEGLLNLKNKSK